MSDHDTAPDPIDEAYVQAEALLSDEAQRAARRARVLGAVAGQPASAAAGPVHAAGRTAWRRGGWLAAACVAGLSVFIAVKTYHPISPQPQTEASAPSAQPSATPPSPTPSAGAPTPANPALARPSTPATAGKAASRAPTAPTASAPLQAPADASEAASQAPAASPPVIAQAAPRPPAPPIEPARRAFPAEAPPPPPVVAKTERGAPPAANYAAALAGNGRDEAAEAQGGLARPASKSESSPAFAEAPAGDASDRLRAPANLPSHPAARLRAAAAAGRTAEVESLLDQGAPADAPDADGDTALIKSVQADHPAAAAALRRHGASLDHRNRAGESARDIATAKDDAALDKAIGLAR